MSGARRAIPRRCRRGVHGQPDGGVDAAAIVEERDGDDRQKRVRARASRTGQPERWRRTIRPRSRDPRRAGSGVAVQRAERWVIQRQQTRRASSSARSASQLTAAAISAARPVIAFPRPARPRAATGADFRKLLFATILSPVGRNAPQRRLKGAIIRRAPLGARASGSGLLLQLNNRFTGCFGVAAFSLPMDSPVWHNRPQLLAHPIEKVPMAGARRS